MDFIDELGLAFVAHRLRRLSDRIVEDIADSMRREGLTVPPRSASMILLLAAKGPMGPVDIGRTLRFSHPLIVRSLRILEDLGLVQVVGHDGDQRRRLVALTDRGNEEAAFLIRFNKRLDRVIRSLLDDGAGDAAAFLDSIDAIGRQLDRQSVLTRLNLKVDA